MRILVTAGPTREFLDPVRFLSNRSSGKMGYAIAAAAARRGHRVVLVSGPVSLEPPAGVRVVRVTSAAEMLDAVRRRIRACDVLIMAAAVADWRPARRAARKRKKDGRPWRLLLEPTPDILQTVRPLKGRRLFIGFAAETHALVAGARRKLVSKGLDLVVANDVGRSDEGFDVDTNRVVLVAPGEEPRRWPLLPKVVVAERLLDWIEALRGVKAGGYRQGCQGTGSRR